MKILPTAVLGAIILVLCGALAASALVSPATGKGEWVGVQYTASDSYDESAQGFDGWYYEDWDGTTYERMTYNGGTFDAWQGRHQYALIGWNLPDNISPGQTTDSVLVFEAPVTGTVVVTGKVRKYDVGGGDGIRAKVLHDDTQIWPSLGWQEVDADDRRGVEMDVEVDVTKGDLLRFVVNRNSNINNDSTLWDPSITYTASEAPREPKVEEMKDGQLYLSAPAPYWVEQPGTTSTATISHNGGTPTSFVNGTPVTEPGKHELVITATRTSNSLTSTERLRFIVNAEAGRGNWVGRSFQAADVYSTTKQGAGNWFYKEWDGTDYRLLGFQPNDPRAWQGLATYTRIGWDAPETIISGYESDAVRVFVAPVDGDISISGYVRKLDLNGGDGVQAKILHNSTQIWPESGWQEIEEDDSAGVNAEASVSVSRGDEIRFVLNRISTIDNDTTTWNPTVTYTQSEAPEEPDVTGVAEDTVYSSAVAAQWSDVAGATRAATLSKDGGAPAAYTKGTEISSAGNYVLTVTATRVADEVTYDTVAKVNFSVATDSKRRYVASNGYSTTTQGHENWFYKEWTGATYQDLSYDALVPAWKGSSEYTRIGWNGADTVSPGDTTDVVRVFKAPVEGTVSVKGTVKKRDTSTGDGVRAKILVNDKQVWPTSGSWQTIAFNDATGYDFNFPAYVNPGDEIRFVLNANAHVAGDATYWDPAVHYLADPKKQSLHYENETHHVGDVHPYYEDGTYYLTYLRSPGFVPELITSTNLIDWEHTPLTHDYPPAEQSYYAVAPIKVGSVYHTYYGDFSRMLSSESTDLVNWKNSSSEFAIPNTMSVYNAGARDPYVFWDPDISAYRMLSTAYRANEEYDIGTGMDVSIALTTSTGDTLTDWGLQGDLIRFPNTSVPLTSSQDPEVPQMFKIGERWYLGSSVARQSAHYGGRPSYWIGGTNTLIDEDNWSSKPVHYLDGEDLIAAQVVDNGESHIMWGWIPQDATGSEWSGSLSLPREVYPLEDGTLAVKLPEAFSSDIRGAELYSSASASPVVSETTNWTTAVADAEYSGTGFGMARLPGVHDRFDVEMDVTMTGTATRAGLLIDKGNAGPYGYEVSLDKANDIIRVRRDLTGSGGWETYSEIAVRDGDLDGTNTLRVVAEGDILEVFVNDRYSLAARIPQVLFDADIRVFAADGNTAFENMVVSTLESRKH